MSLRFSERGAVRAVAPFLLLAIVVVVGCSSSPAPGTGESTDTTTEALLVKKCGPCMVPDCQTCGPEDGCRPARTTCTCDADSTQDGKSCNDGNACDRPGTCNAGSCVSPGPVTCTAPDECHVASCNWSSGCTSTPAPDGTPCGPLGKNTCSAGTCVAPCGLMTCESQNVHCGQTGDGCGHIINCGTCTAPETCGGGGVPSTCGAPHCTKQTCAQIGASCGMQADGCGGLMDCGSCAAPLTCGGSGVHNVCGTGPVCKPKTCADYPAGTCGKQADGCGGATPDCTPCTAPQTCGGAGVLDHCGYCGGFGYPPCSYGCNSGALDDGQGHCVQCDGLRAHITIKGASGQPLTPNWNVEVDYSLSPSASSFAGVVQLQDGATGATFGNAVQGPTGSTTFVVPMLTSENNNFFVTLSKAGDPACNLTGGYPVSATVTWNDTASSSLCTPPKVPNLANQSAGSGDIGSRIGPVGLVPLLWGFSDQAFADNLNVVYRQYQNSNYYQWLRREYQAPQLAHSYPQTVPAAASGSVKDQLDSFIRNGQVPNQGYLVYIVHLAPGIVVSTSDLGTICVSGGNYAYNTKAQTFSLTGGYNTFFYVVVPDPRTVCYGNVLGQNAFTTILTHELAENLTDPDPDGVAGWEDKSCTGNGPQSQIGDLCTPGIPLNSGSLAAAIWTPWTNPATGNNFLTVQKLWSNKMGACVTEDAAGAQFN